MGFIKRMQRKHRHTHTQTESGERERERERERVEEREGERESVGVREREGHNEIYLLTHCLPHSFSINIRSNCLRRPLTTPEVGMERGGSVQLYPSFPPPLCT